MSESLRPRDWQLPLPGFNALPTPAERVFIGLARHWHDAFAVVDADRPAPRAVDELALAALLLASDFRVPHIVEARQQITTNISLTQNRRAPWIDRLPWSLAGAVDQLQPGRSRDCDELVGNLNHHNLRIRVWMMEMAWMVRSWLDRDTALPALPN